MDQEMTLTRKITVLVSVLGLFALSGLASAATEEDREDTTFNYGYDEGNRILLWGASASDALYECGLENGPLDATYGAEEGGIIQIPLLESDGIVVSFPARAQEDLADGLDEADGPIDYSGSDGECGVTGVSVEGPNSQVNHGMFMKGFNSVFSGPGRGCLARHLAQSDLGKGDQQVQVPDADTEDTEESEDSEDVVGTVEFTTAAADCERGKAGNGNNGNGDGNGNGNRPDDPGAQGRANAAEKKSAAGQERGNSASAPGRNK